MLTDLIYALPRGLHRWLLARLGLTAGMHEWVHQFCPCGEEHE